MGNHTCGGSTESLATESLCTEATEAASAAGNGESSSGRKLKAHSAGRTLLLLLGQGGGKADEHGGDEGADLDHFD